MSDVMRPFEDGDCREALDSERARVVEEIEALDNHYVAKASMTELKEHFVEKGTVHPLVLHAESRHIEGTSGTKLDVTHDWMRAVFPGDEAIVQGTKLEIAVPFGGGCEAVAAGAIELDGEKVSADLGAK